MEVKQEWKLHEVFKSIFTTHTLGHSQFSSVAGKSFADTVVKGGLKPSYQDPICGAGSFPNRLSSGCCLQSCLVQEHPGSWAAGYCRGSQISVSFPLRIHITKSLQWKGTSSLKKWRQQRKDVSGSGLAVFTSACLAPIAAALVNVLNRRHWGVIHSTEGRALLCAPR